MGIWFIKISVVYFFIGTVLGFWIHQMPQFAAVHPHFNLLGWVSMAIMGGIYHLFPKAGESKLAKVHFWLHALGMPIMLIGLALLGFGIELFIIPAGGLIVVIGVLLFMINVLKNVWGRVERPKHS